MIHFVPEPLPQNAGIFEGVQLVLYGIIQGYSDPFQQAVLGYNRTVFTIIQRIFATQAWICTRGRNSAQRFDAVVLHKLKKRIPKLACQFRIAPGHYNRTHSALGQQVMVAKRPEAFHKRLGGRIDHPGKRPTADNQRLCIEYFFSERFPIILNDTLIIGQASIAGLAGPDSYIVEANQFRWKA
jgi:hypothetical protein